LDSKKAGGMAYFLEKMNLERKQKKIEKETREYVALEPVNVFPTVVARE